MEFRGWITLVRILDIVMKKVFDTKQFCVSLNVMASGSLKVTRPWSSLVSAVQVHERNRTHYLQHTEEIEGL